jgi:ATP-dependent exoDNAse (exonuclease V) alpha subunit
MRCILSRSARIEGLAIAFANVGIVNAGSGSAVGLSCYIGRCSGRDELQGQSFSFAHRGEIIATGMLLPDHAPEWARDPLELWNQATSAEYVTDRKTGEFRLSKHGDPQVAKSYVLALPKELSNEQNSEIVQRYVTENFAAANVAVQWAIHPDHDGTGNIHAHLLVSTRKLDADGFGKKARELNPSFAYSKENGRGYVSEQQAVGEKWAAFQNAFFREKGIDLVVDPTRIVPDVNLSNARFVENSDKEQRRAALAERNREAARDPEKVVAHLTKTDATFTARQVETFLRKSCLPEAEQNTTREAIFARPDLVRLEETRQTKSGRTVVVERFTLQRIIAQESRVLDDGAVLRGRGDHQVSDRARQAAEGSRTLTDEQREAFRYATGGDGLAIIQGRAGTGKSYTAGAIREAYERDGFRVIGLAPTNTVAADMRADGFREGRTLASELGSPQKTENKAR